MKIIFFLLAIASFGIFVLAGCGNTAPKINTATTQNTAEKANTAVTKTDESVKSNLKPGDVSPDKALKVIELVDSVAADKGAWKGKEVAVTGYVSGMSSSGKNQLVTLINDQTATIKKDVSCAFPGEKPDGIFTKTIEVKGKIEHIEAGGEYQSVNLEPCELKK